jgi:hypothetical protein
VRNHSCVSLANQSNDEFRATTRTRFLSGDKNLPLVVCLLNTKSVLDIGKWFRSRKIHYWHVPENVPWDPSDCCPARPFEVVLNVGNMARSEPLHLRLSHWLSTRKIPSRCFLSTLVGWWNPHLSCLIHMFDGYCKSPTCWWFDHHIFVV